MDATSNLLVEIGTEELPPTALLALSNAFVAGFRDELEGAGIGFETIEPFASPRRLALLVRGILTRQPDRETLRRGPAIQAAFGADGQPTRAALGFAGSCGVPVDALAREVTEKGEWLAFQSRVIGEFTTSLVPNLTDAALARLPIPKRMRWGEGSEEFVRPVHWVCLLLGTEAIPGRILGIEAGRRTHGHRFHHPEPIDVPEATAYAELLRSRGSVEPDFDRRRELVRSRVEELASANGLSARIDDALLDEVTALVEWPRAILGRFDEAYLAIPPEVLIETMRSNQKYFPVEDSSGVLQASFITVANIESRDPDQVRAGNERVIRPRFADAAFFWAQDLKQPLEGYAERLETVVFQDRLGTVAEKSARVANLARGLASSIGVDPDLAARAARLSRCDLVTSMVYEFPGLQGTMGRYYAEHANEAPCVCAAMEEQYLPRFAGDVLPASPCGRVLAIADRIDTLVGIFGIGLRPTGAKDPYGLRRASIGVLRILIETPLELDLRELIASAASSYPAGLLSKDVEAAALGYVIDRLRGYYHERGVAGDTIEAVLQTGVTVPADLDARLAAVTAFRALSGSASLAAANKRIRNILSKAGIDIGVGSARLEANGELLDEPAEIRLAARVAELSSLVLPLAQARDYMGVLQLLSELEGDLEAFFDQVMVMVDDPEIRENRIRLLHSLAGLFLLVADISRLQE
ncbi:glycine--tRNA ligase subunit beta [Thiocapsa bogorovii]|uniref:glycine--tRNA ligase subunit beta n=1 Tax=Thiocapsa bogorovii TaxID=521689 RepID=UPI001E36541A|nr:glycine--tRNA ligase subunit beta [Thiocapsa bogorovii]UHD18850.1 glycine--tRNA ligase subunit beta [Thiocapsa bogorovii]